MVTYSKMFAHVRSDSHISVRTMLMRVCSIVFQSCPFLMKFHRSNYKNSQGHCCERRPKKAVTRKGLCWAREPRVAQTSVGHAPQHAGHWRVGITLTSHVVQVAANTSKHMGGPPKPVVENQLRCPTSHAKCLQQ